MDQVNGAHYDERALLRQEIDQLRRDWIHKDEQNERLREKNRALKSTNAKLTNENDDFKSRNYRY